LDARNIEFSENENINYMAKSVVDVLLKLYKVDNLNLRIIKNYFDNTFRSNDVSKCVFIETLNMLEKKYHLSLNKNTLKEEIKMLSESEVQRIKNKYPTGTRIELLHMYDNYGVPDGTLGTVDYVDDAGQIQMNWDNGRTLALIESEDNFRIIELPKDNIDMEVKI